MNKRAHATLPKDWNTSDAVAVEPNRAIGGMPREQGAQSSFMTDNMSRVEEIALSLPEAQRVDIEAWDGQPTFRVRGKNFVFCNADATSLTVKLSKLEAEAVVATAAFVTAAGYGLGRHGWVAVDIGGSRPKSRLAETGLSEAQWDQLEEWIYTSYTLVAPKRLAKIVLDTDTLGRHQLDS